VKKLFVALALAAIGVPVLAATQTVTLSVPGMTCSTCPITVKKAISKVEGVNKIDVTFEARVVESESVTFARVNVSIHLLGLGKLEIC